jgi:peptidoglycan/LPS O-acetylase OafA/YrhL
MKKLEHDRDNRALNVIRSVSALLVVLGHVRLLFFQNYADAPHNAVSATAYAVTSLGSEAVIVFFVLSGYFVGGSVVAKVRRGSFSWANYASARLTRLWLVLIPALALTFILDMSSSALMPHADIITSPDSYGGVPSSPTHSWLALLGNLGFVQGIHVPVYGYDQPLWSLANEFWYYLMFPAVLIAFRSGRWYSRLASGLVLLLAAITSGPEVLLLFPAWLAGAAIGTWKTKIVALIARTKRTRLAVIRAIVIIATFGVMIVAREVNFPSRSGAWMIAIASAVLVAVFVVDVQWRNIAGRILGSVSRTAHFSYSLYAIHMPIIVALCAFLIPNVHKRWQMNPTSAAVALVIVVGLGGISWAFASVTENRTEELRAIVMRLSRRWRADRAETQPRTAESRNSLPDARLAVQEDCGVDQLPRDQGARG